MRIRFLVLAAALFCGRVSAAEPESKSAPIEETRPAILVPQPPSPKPAPTSRYRRPPPPVQSRRAISPELSQKISEVAGRAAPASANEAAKTVTSASESNAGSDATQLEAVIVNEDKVPKLKERDVLTPREKLELAYKQNPGLKAGVLPLGNKGVALEMLAAEVEQQRRSELRELNSVLKAGGTKPPPDVQRKIDEAVSRRGDWLSQQPGTPFREPR